MVALKQMIGALEKVPVWGLNLHVNARGGRGHGTWVTKIG